MIQRNGVFLVTGASAGLGKAITTGLARQGATVVMVARNRQKGEEVKAEIIAVTGNSSLDLLVADLSSQHDVRRVEQNFGSTILICMASLIMQVLNFHTARRALME